MKEHQAAGVTGCLKNVAYGDFSNMDRSHRFEQTNTKTFIGMLASTEPVRSRVVLNIMDGLRGVWHQGPFSREERFRFYPKQIMFGTDPVAMDHKLIDVIEEKRKAEGATSLWERSQRVPRRQPRSQVQPLHPRARPRRVCFDARPGRVRRQQNQTAGDRAVMLLLVAAVLPRLFWDAGPETAPALREAGIERIAVPGGAVGRMERRGGNHHRGGRSRKGDQAGRAVGGLSREPGQRQPRAVAEFEWLAVRAPAARRNSCTT